MATTWSPWANSSNKTTRMPPWHCFSTLKTRWTAWPTRTSHAAKGRKAGTLELVVHPNYIVVFAQTDTTVTVFNLLHVARQYP